MQAGFQHPCWFRVNLHVSTVSLLVHGHSINKFWHNPKPTDAAENPSIDFDGLGVGLPVTIKQKYFGN